MLITMLRGRAKQAMRTAAAMRPVPRSIAVMDMSGPLPETSTRPKPAPAQASRRGDSAPYVESAMVGAALTPTTYRRDATDMSTLPRELDPFESDFPWIGWVEPRHESVVRSDRRSPTFEHDLQRVLSIFAN